MRFKTLVLINLRGGADALNFVIPYRESNYYRLRPSLALPEKQIIHLDGFFGLHPALEPLLPHYEQGKAAIIHAAGWPGESHSHFEAWDDIESGVAGSNRPLTGWTARYLQLLSPTPRSPLRAAAFGTNPSGLLKGALGACTLKSLDEYRLSSAASDRQRDELRSLYKNSKSKLASSALQTLDALDAIDGIIEESNRSNRSNGSNGSNGYPDTEFGRDLRAVEQLIKSGIGLEAASIDLKGWDTHFYQGSTEGQAARLMDEFAKGVSRFMNNLEGEMDNILIAAMSEFGRRTAENGSGGTDHGRGGVMLFFGGGVRGGRVYGEWPGLSDASLTPPGDLTITTDYRDALGDIVAAQLGEKAVEHVFPGWRRAKRLGIFAE